MIDGTAYVREPPSPSMAHQEILGGLCVQIANALEDSPSRVYIAPLDVRLPKTGEADDQIDTEVWLVHPDDRTLRIYRLENGCYGRATVLELKGQTALIGVGDVIIDWDEVLARLT